MRNSELINSAMLLMLGTLLTFCKVEKQKTMNDGPIETNSVSVKDLAEQGSEKLNPDEALIRMRTTAVNIDGEEITIRGDVLAVEGKSFGFSSVINSGENILMVTNQNISLDTNQELRCVIKEMPTRGQNSPTYRLIRMIH